MRAFRFRILVAAAVSTASLLVISSLGRRPTTAPHRARLVSVGPLTLRVVRAGSGPTVVLIHGYGESLISWRPVFDQLSRDADVIAFDLPGFGVSSKPVGGYTADSLASVVLGLLDELRVRRAVLVGHSLGGAVATAVAIHDPDRVAGLVLVAPALATPTLLGVAGESGARAAQWRTLVASRYEALRTRFGGIHDAAWLTEDPAQAAYEASGDSAYLRSLASVLAEFDFAFLTPQAAAGLKAPTLVIWGANDPLVPLGSAQSLVDAIPGSSLEILARTWHRPHLERPKDVGRLLAGFLRHLRPGEPVPTP
jgi:2-hydroxy-6-oxonona-2,4-dienedioate hydrolase